MIDIGCTNREPAGGLLRTPGGFAWWYADLVTPRGDGLVLIWSYGLPFLPGYAAAARRGAPQLPRDRPSVNVVAYRRGAPSFYLLQEHPADGADGATEGTQRIGRCTFERRVEDGLCTLEAALDCAVPGTGERLTGTVRIRGAARRGYETAGSDEPPHVWTPLTGPAMGEAALDFGGRPLLHLSGRAYHDRNSGRVPLHELGIARWMWGRFPLVGREAVYYLLWPEDGGAPTCIGLEVDEAGGTRRLELEAELGAPRRGLAGLTWPQTLTLREAGLPWLRVRHTALADDGPFYLRMLSECTTAAGETAVGWGEVCHPARVDLAAHRPLVRMRVHLAAGGNSAWLPLFTGPREGRVGRLLRHAITTGR